MFDSVVMSTGGPEFYKKAFIDLDESALKSDTMKKAFDNLAKLQGLCRSRTSPAATGTSPPPWSSRATPGCR